MKLPGEIITSRANQTVVLTGKLGDRKWREQEKLFRFDGVKLYCEAVLRGVEIAWVLLRASDAERVLGQIRSLYDGRASGADPRTLLLADAVFDKISEEKSPEGIITVGKYIDKFHKIVTIDNSAVFAAEGTRSSFCVLLESVRDPVNVGTVIRSAAALGADRVILSEDCADLYHPKTLRAAMGALFTMPVFRVGSMPETIGALRAGGHRVFAAALNPGAARLHTLVPETGDCVVIGNEGHGLTEETIAACDAAVYIPMRNGVESLNAAAAASVLIWHFGKHED